MSRAAEQSSLQSAYLARADQRLHDVVENMSLSKILSGANACEISDIQEDETWVPIRGANQAIRM